MFYKDGTLYTEYEFKRIFKDTSFPNGNIDSNFAISKGFNVVTFAQAPSVDDAIYTVIQNTVPTVINNEYVLEYSIVEKTEEEKIAYAKSLVPQSITPLQAKLQLLNIGLLDEVEAMVSADRRIALYWEYALDIQRSHPTLSQMAEALGLTDAQLDEMFIEASKLS